MKRLATFLLLVVGLAVSLTAGWRVLRPEIEERLGAFLVRELGALSGGAATLDELRVQVAPPTLEVRGVALGPEGGAIRAAWIRLQLLPFTSLTEMAMVGDVDASDLWVDVPFLTRDSGEGGDAVAPPPIQLRNVRIDAVHVRVAGAESELDVAARELNGSLALGIGRARFAFDLRAAGVVLGRRGNDLALGDVTMAAADRGQGFVVDELDARGPDLVASVTATAGADGGRSWKADVSLDRLAFFADEFSGLVGAARLEGTLDGAISDVRVEADLQVEDLAFRGVAVGDVRATLGLADGVLRVDPLRASPLGGEVELRGWLELAGSLPTELSATWRHIDPADALDAALGRGRIASLRASGRAEVSAALRPWSASGKADGSVETADGQARLGWSVQGRHAPSGNEAELLVRDGGNELFRGRIGAGTDDGLDGRLQVTVPDLAAFRGFVAKEAWPAVGGSLRAEADLSGQLRHPALAGRLKGENVSLQGVEIERATAVFRIDPQHLVVDDLRLQAARGTVAGAGTVALAAGVENDWRMRAEGLSIDQILGWRRRPGDPDLPVEGGTVGGRATGRGPWQSLVLGGVLSLETFRVMGEPIDTLALEVDAKFPDWAGTATLNRADEERLVVEARGKGAAEVALTVESTVWSVANLERGARVGLTGRFSLDGRLAGPPAKLDGSLHMRGQGLAWEKRRIGDVDLRGEAASGKWHLTGTFLDGAVHADASIDRLPGGVFSARLEWHDADFGPLLGRKDALHLDSSGWLRLGGDLSRPAELEGEARLEKLSVASGAFRLEAVGPIHAMSEHGTFVLDRFSLKGNGTELSGDGRIGLDGSLDLNAEGHGSLQVLEMIGDPLESAAGTFRLTVAARRPADGEIDLGGEILVESAAVDAGLPVGLTGTSGRLTLSGSTLRIETLAGRLGGGTFALGGTVDAETGPDLTWQVHEISTGLLPDLEHEISGDGTVRGAWNDLTVAGEVHVLRMLYARRIDLIDFLPSFRRSLAPPPRRSAAPVTVHLDLRIKAPGELFIDNNFAQIEAKANLRVGGTVDHLRLSGPVEVLSGEVFFRGRTFEVLSGVVEFRRELGAVATLNIVAESEIETGEDTYTVTIRIEGTTEDYRVTMTADDASLSQTDVGALIAFGKTTAQLQEEGGGIALGDLMVLAPGGYTERAELGAARFLRLDAVDFQPSFSRGSGEFEPQLRLGKNLTENLSATLTKTFGTESGEIFSIDYRLTPELSTVGSWESETASRAAAFGGGLKFRRHFRDTPGFSLLWSDDPDDLDGE